MCARSFLLLFLFSYSQLPQQDFRNAVFALDTREDTHFDFYNLILKRAFPSNSKEIFAFSFAPEFKTKFPWTLYDPTEEFMRQGVLNPCSNWRYLIALHRRDPFFLINCYLFIPLLSKSHQPILFLIKHNRLSTVNSDYSLCSTYPKTMVPYSRTQSIIGRSLDISVDLFSGRPKKH